MPMFRGFNTINQYKRFTMTDHDLIKRDLLNAFLIRRGEKPGRPGYGTTLWDFIFENNTSDIQNQVLAEIRRVISDETRVRYENAELYAEGSGILVEVDITYADDASAETLRIWFDDQNFQARYV